MEQGRCRLLSGSFSLLVQGFLASICIITLLVKRQMEIPRRAWRVWFFDVMKQAVGSFFGHSSNILLSLFLTRLLSERDECRWYCVIYITDASLGMTFNLVFIYLVDILVIKQFPSLIFLKVGEYGSPPKWSFFLPQLLIYLIIVLLSKLMLLGILENFVGPLDDGMGVIFRGFITSHPEFELFLVMIIIPTILNVVQFWITDVFLKKPDIHVLDRHPSADVNTEELELESGFHHTHSPLLQVELSASREKGSPK